MFSRPLSITEESQTLTQLSDNFVQNPVQLMGQNLTVLEAPVLVSENGVPKNSMLDEFYFILFLKRFCCT